VASRHPEWSIVLVGPVKPLGADAEPFEKLSRLPNVHLLGPKPIQALPSYVQHFDVCIMPYDRDGYTKFIYPLKLHEYLATGVPVVGTPIRTLQEFAGTIALGTSGDEWGAAISAALGPEARTPEAQARRRAVAAQHDWEVITHRVARVLARPLGPRVSELVETAPIAAAVAPTRSPAARQVSTNKDVNLPVEGARQKGAAHR
jgi:glycosyltransferase involved in cell wall biosynthesis